MGKLFAQGEWGRRWGIPLIFRTMVKIFGVEQLFYHIE
jgi:hypothetical protein